jgi:hypothetical protein
MRVSSDEQAAGERTGGISLSRSGAGDGSDSREERLPFKIRIASDQMAIAKAVSVRHAAYTRHVPAFAESLRAPEWFDQEAGSVVFLAESKLDGSPLGTMRIHTNRYHKLPVEQSVTLPECFQGKRLTEATRLGITVERVGRLVKTMLFKAFLLYCIDEEVDWIVVCARSPLDRQYEDLLFTDVFPGRGYMRMALGGNMLYRVLAFEIATAEARWAAARHPMYDLFGRTHHPDIQVGTTHELFPADRLRRKMLDQSSLSA